MARNGLKRVVKEAELFRRYLHAWQEVIEVSEELHQIVLDDGIKDLLRTSVNGTKEAQQFIITYLKQADVMFTILDEKLGEFPRSVQ